MITKPTTLILGAGASASFDFPTGDALLKKALNWAIVGPGRTNPELFRGLGIELQKFSLFREALLKSGRMSVDAFLEHRPEFIDVGKIVIALELIGCERENALFNLNEISWYQYLFNELNTQFDDFDKNKLRILTFNYDRSLEYYLLTALHHSYGKPIGECAQKLKTIPIIHLHGDLGGLPELEDKLVRPYNQIVSSDSLKIATQRIKIIHEDVEREPQFNQAKAFLATSEIICFLGFGYHPLNLKRLGFNRDSYRNAIHFGSTYGLTPAECNNVSQIFNSRFSPHNHQAAMGKDVLQFLRNTGILQLR